MAAFLERPLVASFVTLRADGSPEVAPVWYQFADGDFIVYTSRTFRRVRNIERDSRVVISIAPHDTPYAYVTAEGRAVITRDGVAEVARAITERYMQGQAAEDFLERNAGRRLRPATVHAGAPHHVGQRGVRGGWRRVTASRDCAATLGRRLRGDSLLGSKNRARVRAVNFGHLQALCFKELEPKPACIHP